MWKMEMLIPFVFFLGSSTALMFQPTTTTAAPTTPPIVPPNIPGPAALPFPPEPLPFPQPLSLPGNTMLLITNPGMLPAPNQVQPRTVNQGIKSIPSQMMQSQQQPSTATGQRSMMTDLNSLPGVALKRPVRKASPMFRTMIYSLLMRNDVLADNRFLRMRLIQAASRPNLSVNEAQRIMTVLQLAGGGAGAAEGMNVGMMMAMQGMMSPMAGNASPGLGMSPMGMGMSMGAGMMAGMMAPNAGMIASPFSMLAPGMLF